MIAIIKYNGGNVSSVQNALDRLGVDSVITDDPEQITKADKVIFPGVGEASSTMKLLKEKGLDVLIPTLTQPVLGICLGMQLMCKENEEGNTEGMGIFDCKVKRFPPQGLVPTWAGIRFQARVYLYLEDLRPEVMSISFTAIIVNCRIVRLRCAIIFCHSVLHCRKIISMQCVSP